MYNKGIEQGIEQGIEEGKVRMITKALKQGLLTVEQIAEMAEVSVAYVVAIQNKD